MLLSAWDEPRKGDAAYRQMDLAIGYLQKIHKTVITASADSTTDPLVVAQRTAAVIGLPLQAVTPLLARTIAANLRVRACSGLDADS